MQLILIRHLPTEWNRRNLLQGRRDIDILPINKGVKQKINENKRKLKEMEPIECVVSSELKRAQQTAITYGYQAKIEPLVNELDFGSYEGKEKSCLFKKEKWLHNPRTLTLGENLVDFERRIFSFLYKYRHKKSILIFGHGTWIRALLSIKQIGDINHMNQLTVRNNEIFTTRFSQYELKNDGQNM